MNLQTLPGLFISHGSPMLALDPEQVGPALLRLGLNLPKPHAILVMSAHWESEALEVSTGVRPETWHDFRGFPKELYEIRYPAPGNPELAEEILKRLAEGNIPAHANSTRPRDHGVWMPLLHMYPNADIPVIEISLPMNMNADYVVSKLNHNDFDAVLDWENIPYMQQSHPTLEHFAPLFFAMGIGHRFNIVHSSFSMGSLGMDIYRFD